MESSYEHALISEGGAGNITSWRPNKHFDFKFLRFAFRKVLLEKLAHKLGSSFLRLKNQIYKDHPDGFYVRAKPNLCSPDITMKYISRYLGRPVIATPGRHGSVIYLNNYLSTMFQVSDVMIDKDEVSMAFHIPFHAPDSSLEITDSPIRDEQISVPSEENSVSKPHMHAMVRKVAKILATQGLPCCECSRTIYKLYPLSDCMEGHFRYSLEISCPDGWNGYYFELTLSPAAEKKGGMMRNG